MSLPSHSLTSSSRGFRLPQPRSAVVPNDSPHATPDPIQLRRQLRQAYLANRQATLDFVVTQTPDQLNQQIHPDFSPIGWHLGHIGFTEELWLLGHLAGQPMGNLSYQTGEYRRLFAADGLPKSERGKLPSLSEMLIALEHIRQRVWQYLDIAPVVEQEWLWWWLLQHEAQHGETMAILQQLQQSRLPWLGGYTPNPASAADLPPLDIAGLDADMVVIPAGRFWQGSDASNALDNESPCHPVDLPAYVIDRYPVTRGQFRQFMEAGGYRQSDYWSPAGWRWLQDHPVAQPLYWHHPLGDDHPVYGVSYYEAEAYAHFVGKRLPSESEWEKAAQGINGVGSCNHGNLWGQTTPVHHYPQGQSDYGCHDLLGNVWEWTGSWFAGYPGYDYAPYPGYSQVYFDNEHRVLKGGSWATRAVALRPSFRNWYLPQTREIFAGFRCARDCSGDLASSALASSDLVSLYPLATPIPVTLPPTSPPPSERLTIVDLLSATQSDQEKQALEQQAFIQGLSQFPKTIAPQYFYDQQGSLLFEQICTLPEYYPTRTEAWILQTFAAEIAQLTGPCELVELGSGSATKTRLLLDAYAQNTDTQMAYLPIDVSGEILETSAQSLLADYPLLQIYGLIATYELGLAHLPASQLPNRMLAFLGSTLGNLNPAECALFFGQVRAALQPGQFFLLGVDLQKPIPMLEAAYNDSQGVTAAFNLNMLQHLNQRFQANFDLSQFQHRAFYNQMAHQIEMHLASRCAQTVRFEALDFEISLAAGETIHTEISRKFSLPQLQQELERFKLMPRQIWTDPQQWFGLLLCQYI
jgi:gamma-glutamyl hercynylcysteine S-oxide synthase